jgi:anti-sigma factor RsiW
MSLMHCREFRNKHVAFVDDLLPSFEMAAMRRHLNACSGCARQDTQIRRSLLLVRNLPPIAASPEFMQRLTARLESMGPVSREDVVPSRASRASLSALTSAASIAALAAGLMAIAYLAVETNNYFAQPGEINVAARAVAVTQPVQVDAPSPITNAALVASVPTGIPVWPAVLMVGQSPMRFASMEFSDDARAR